MGPFSVHRWPRVFPGPAAALLGLLLSAVLAGPAMAAGGIHYLNYSSFRVPFDTAAKEQIQIRQVILYVSEDQTTRYKAVTQAPPTEKGFLFNAPRQGWYWFIVQAEYMNGRKVPADVQSLQPGLQVFVDLTPPQIVLSQIQAREGMLAVEWNVSDDYPDALSSRLSYRPVGQQDWIPLPQAPQRLPADLTWAPAVNAAQYEVRLQAKDRAGNSAEKSIRVTPGQARAPQQPLDNGGPKLTMVNTRRIKLNYELAQETVGSSKVAHVQVWKTENDGRTWKPGPKEPPVGHVIVDVEHEGRYGFILRAFSGAGKAEPDPRSGDKADFWVEVDETKPDVRIVGLDVGSDFAGNNLTIRWVATDKYLLDRPISIFYTDKQPSTETQWKEVAADIPNVPSQKSWLIPPDVSYEVWIKIEAKDQAGNVGFKQSDRVIVDTKVPKARIKGAEAAPQGAPPAQPPGNSGGALAPAPSNLNPIQPTRVDGVPEPQPSPLPPASSSPVNPVPPVAPPSGQPAPLPPQPTPPEPMPPGPKQ